MAKALQFPASLAAFMGPWPGASGAFLWSDELDVSSQALNPGEESLYILVVLAAFQLNVGHAGKGQAVGVIL